MKTNRQHNRQLITNCKPGDLFYVQIPDHHHPLPNDKYRYLIMISSIDLVSLFIKVKFLWVDGADYWAKSQVNSKRSAHYEINERGLGDTFLLREDTTLTKL